MIFAGLCLAYAEWRAQSQTTAVPACAPSTDALSGETQGQRQDRSGRGASLPARTGTKSTDADEARAGRGYPVAHAASASVPTT